MITVTGTGVVAQGSVNFATVGNDNTPVLEFRVVHVRKFGKDRGRSETVSINVKLWGKRAEGLKDLVAQTILGSDDRDHGRKVFFTGELCMKPPAEDADEDARPFTYVNLSEIEFLDFVPKSEGKGKSKAKPAEQAASV